MQRPTLSLVLIAVFLLVSSASGCSALVGQGHWQTPKLMAPDYALLKQGVTVRSGSLDLARANIAYSQAVEAMERGEAECVDHFFHAAIASWRDIEAKANETCIHGLPAFEIYRSSLNALIVQGQHHKRFDPRTGLNIRENNGWFNVPCQFYGFARSPDDFDCIITVGDYSTSQLNNFYRQDGFGVPAIVRCLSSQERFQRKQSSFVATLLLRSESDAASSSSPALEFHNPLVASAVTVNGCSFPLAYDKSAAIARTLSTTKRKYVQAFLQPGNVDPDEEGLFMLEPYVPGKIPIVFIHGLLSDRLTWSNLVNEIRSRPSFHERFQIWGFEYPTGEPFLHSAAMLRNQLRQLCCQVDPEDTDQALKHVVLVGHSMGGLISKLQISCSGNSLWDSIANRRFDDVRMAPQIREKLAESVFFEPVPMISRVVYIGTPHRGSSLANRAVGRVGSLLIAQPEEFKISHRQLLDDNPDTFSNEFERRIPTSLDLLEPESPLLSAIGKLPTAPNVHTHSIIGSGRWMLGNGDSDGVVPVSSARQLTADSERLVGEKHADLTQDPSTIDEVLSILREHYQSLVP